MILADDAFAHQGVRDRQFQRFGECHELRGCARRQDTAPGVQDRPLGVGER